MNRPRTIPALLAVVAVLMAADLTVRLAARAEFTPTLQAAPRVVGMTQNISGVLFRIWSDGVVETRHAVIVSGNPSEAGLYCYSFQSLQWNEIADPCPG